MIRMMQQVNAINVIFNAKLAKILKLLVLYVQMEIEKTTHQHALVNQDILRKTESVYNVIHIDALNVVVK